jgi:hypothetical protein
MTERADNRACAHAFVAVAFGLLASCGGPTKPTPPVVGPATPPVIRSIAIPASRVEVEVDVPITAVIEDAETPLGALAFQWSASAGTISGTGTSAIWRMPAGLKAGLDVAITLRVVDTYDAVVNNVVIKQQFIVTLTSGTFRVHDSEAEVKELARKFLVDLFGNSSVPPAACMVDFADVCANLGEGKNHEVDQIVNHRATVVLTNSQLLNQRHAFFGPNSGTVHTAMLYTGHPTTSLVITSGCGDFELTVIYVGNRWWLCESYFNEADHSFCPAGTSNSQLLHALRRGKTLH